MTRILALDPGHGGHDPGAVGNGLQEKDVVLDICKRAKQYIDSNYPDIDCKLTRTTDRFVSLGERTNNANNWKAHCFVSVHCNAFVSPSARGFESFVYTTDSPASRSVALQQKIHHPLANLWTGRRSPDRGPKKANFHVVREFQGAAVLLELGFISNPEDATLLKQPSFLQQQAETLADAVADYLNVKKRPVRDNLVYRVRVDGKQVGAYGMPTNVGAQVQQAVEAGSSKIEIELIK